jgi:hypothetical protein
MAEPNWPPPRGPVGLYRPRLLIFMRTPCLGQGVYKKAAAGHYAPPLFLFKIGTMGSRAAG